VKAMLAGPSYAIRTPDGDEMPAFGEDLAMESDVATGAPVQMMQLNHGIFDEASPP